MVNIHQKGLQLNWAEPLEAIAVRADPAKLKQVFLNVLSNAIKFTDTGSITISILEAAVASTRDKIEFYRHLSDARKNSRPRYGSWDR